MYSTVIKSTILPVHSLYDELTSEGVIVYRHRAGDDHSGAGIEERSRVKEPAEN